MKKSNKTIRFTPLSLWQKIDWKQVNQYMRTIQNQLVIAVKRKDIMEIKRLQNQINRSFSARALAVKKVVSNQGKRTAGIDKQLWPRAEQKSEAIKSLRNLRDYQAKPVRRVWIDKPGKKEKRPLGIPTLFDRAVQAVYLQSLDPAVETLGDRRSFGFRKARSVHDAAMYIKLVCGSMYGKRHILEIDIKQFFPSINHQWLLQNTPMDKRILQQFLKAGIVETSKYSETVEGVPQGGIISPTLSNSVLNGLEEAIKEAKGTFLVRYADDFVVLGNDRQSLEIAKKWIESFLEMRGLRIHEEKSKFTTIEEGFDFLGFHFREYKDKGRSKGRKQGIFLVTPTKRNVTAVLEKARKIVKNQTQVSAGKIIQQLNPILRGWAEHYRSVSSRKAFRTISNEVYKLLIKWMDKKHRGTARRELVRRYFKTIRIGKKTNNWVFFGLNERGEEILLFQIGSVTMKKHPMIAIENPKNPYLIEDQGYFEARAISKLKKTALLDERKRKLLIKQKGLCYLCEQPIEPEQKSEIHHIIPVKEKGSNHSSNLAVVHWVCHGQIHMNLKRTAGK